MATTTQTKPAAAHKNEMAPTPQRKSSGDQGAARLNTPTYLTEEQAAEIAEGLNRVNATAVALWLKTKNFHWHLSGPHFRDYHLLFDEQSAAILAIVDPVAERCRKIGQPTLRSVGHVDSLQVTANNDADYVDPVAMVHELMEDNRVLNQAMLDCHDACDEYKDVATASLLEVYMDEAERRVWFLFETARGNNEL